MEGSMTVKIARTRDETRRCFPVMGQLRPHLAEPEFLERVELQRKEGYTLAYLEEGNAVVACAGYRTGHTLYSGHYLYVDDLVTDDRLRSQGHGKKLLAWLEAEARRLGCDTFCLDSGLWRTRTHEFYRQNGMKENSYHFVRDLSGFSARFKQALVATGQLQANKA